VPVSRRRWLLDGRPLGGKSGVRGIGSYLRGLLGGMHSIGLDERVDLILRRGDPLPELDAIQVRPGPRLPVLKERVQPVADPFLVAALLLRHPYALYHAIEYAQPIASRVPVIATVQDLIPFLFSDPYRGMRRQRLLALRQLRGADAVIVPSRATADDVARIAHVRQDRITVVPHGVDPVYRPASPDRVAETLQRLGIEHPYVLAVSTFDPHKRFALVAEAVTHLDPSLHLVVTGYQGPYEADIRQTLATTRVADRAHLTGHLPLEDVVALYSGARCLLHTSAYEGFGLPLLEAMACGCPVVAFANSAIVETSGDAGIVVSDGDVAALVDAAASVIDDSAERARRIATGRARAAGYTWARTAQATVSLYRTVAPD
jgi:glycosyltransferase involved in cell wall biosynthesis